MFQKIQVGIKVNDDNTRLVDNIEKLIPMENRIQDRELGLYAESPAYVRSMLQDEENGD